MFFRIETFFAITISVGAGVAFGYFGRQLYSRMRNLPVISSSKLAISKKVGDARREEGGGRRADCSCRSG